MAINHIDEDLQALDQRVDCRCQECECTSADLEAANGKIAILKEHSHSQRLLIEQLIDCVNSMEGRLYHCNNGKGKEQVILEEVSPPLGSPLILGYTMDEYHHSDESYHTPPLTNSSVPILSSLTESDKENNEDVPSGLVEIIEGSSNYDVPLLVPTPTINLTQFNHLITVCGQCAVCKLGPPKLMYHPYSRCCTTGACSSTHKPGASCSHKQLGYQDGKLAH